MSSFEAAASRVLPPDVSSALDQGNKVEAMRLLRAHVERAVAAGTGGPAAAPADQAQQQGVVPEIAAAIARGDEAAATSLLREAVEQRLGAAAAPASLSPGQVKQAGASRFLWWAVAAGLLAAALYVVRRAG